MSDKNSRAWANYDSWKLSSPYDDVSEVFETEKYKLFSCSEDTVGDFDTLIAKAIDNPDIYLKDDTSDLESLDDYVELLLGDDDYFWGKLFKDQWDAVRAYEDVMRDARQDYLEGKADAMIQAKKDGE